MFAKIGNSRTIHPVPNLAHASRCYVAMCEAMNLGSTDAPACRILDESGTVIAHVSFNGRVWPGAEWNEGSAPLYDPAAHH